jgi:AraC-like DNA-binding protein/quercetin dioxygenase-like cupin family protein
MPIDLSFIHTHATMLPRLCEEISVLIPPVTLQGKKVVLCSMMYVRKSPGLVVARETHGSYEGHLVLEGTVEYELDTVETLRQGQLILHAPHVEHGWSNPHDAVSFLVFALRVEPSVPVRVPHHWPMRPDLVRTAVSMLVVAHERPPGWRGAVTYKMLTLLSGLLNLTEDTGRQGRVQRDDLQLLQRVDAYISAHGAEVIGLPTLADNVGVSIRTLTRRYRYLAGITVTERIIQERLRLATHLLATTTLPISAIAKRVNLSFPFFSRQFRTLVGESPSDYRRYLQGIPLRYTHTRRPKSQQAGGADVSEGDAPSDVERAQRALERSVCFPTIP